MGDRLPRKLAAILYADVAEYSRLTGEDEDATHRALSKHLDLISATVESHRGEVKHYAGDAVLAKFDAVIDAMSSAVEIQRELQLRNAELPDKCRLQFRIGVNSGDVIEDRGDIYGDGVNVAARLETLADPGGICVSDAVRIALGNKLGLIYEDLGEQQVKNIAEAVRAFNVALDTESGRKNFSLPGSVLKPPDEPSIAVLPFTNMSNDPEQEFFSDGITEDIITALSRVSSMMVIARNSTFVYKGTAVDVKQVGREQGVRYVLEGSVRKAGNRVRITAQLIDAFTGQHIWAERYDRDLEDIFTLQDEITQKIVSELDIRLLKGEQARFWSSSTDNLEAWESYRLARDLMDRYHADDIPEIKRLLNRAIELDPNYAAAWAMLSGVNFHVAEDARYSDEERAQATRANLEYAERALECDPACASAHSMLALHYLNMKNFDKAMEMADKVMELAPNNASVIAISAIVSSKCGRPEYALERIRKAMRLCPVYPLWFLSALGQVSRLSGRIDDAIEAYHEMVRRDPDHLEGHIGLTDALSEADRLDEAKKTALVVLRINPEFSIAEYTENLSFRDPSQVDRFAGGLRKAGLPD